MARDRLAALRARQAAPEPPSAPQQSSRAAQSRVPSDPYDASAPRDFDPYAVEDDGGYPGRPSREEPRLPGPGWQADYSFGGGGAGMGRGGSGGGYGTIVYTNRSATSLNRSLHSRSSSTGSRRYGSRDQANDEPVPPVPSLPLPPHDNTDYTSPPLASDAHYLQTPPEVPLPRDFDPNDSRAQYAVNYAPAYMTPPQSRHETQYTPANPRQTRQRSISTVPGVSAAATGARKTSMVPIAPTASQRAYEQDSLGGGEEYGEEKASTVDLVERDDGNERRESLVKRGGPTISKGQVPFEESGEFFQEVSDLQQALREANGSIQAVGDLQMRMLALPSSEDRMAQEVKSQLDEKTAATRTLFTSIKDRVHVLDQGNVNLRAMIPLGQSLHNLSLEEVAIRQDQVDALKERFKNAIQRYAEVERDYRKNQRARMERQVKVVNPGMSAVEIEEIVKQAEAGGDSAMFSQALQTNGYRSQAARGALKEVQNRAAELARIEATLIELSQLFQDMAVMVYAQDVTIQRIEQDAIKTEQDMEHGLGNVKKAVVHARNARKYRWWCFGIIVVILIVVLVALCATLIPPAIRAANNNNNNNANDNAPQTTAILPVVPITSEGTTTAVPTTSSTISVAPSSTSTVTSLSTGPSSTQTGTSTITGPTSASTTPTTSTTRALSTTSTSSTSG